MSVAKVHYYQGFHDLCSVLLLNCGEKIACACAERLAVFHQRDATRAHVTPLLDALVLVAPLVESVDEERARARLRRRLVVARLFGHGRPGARVCTGCAARGGGRDAGARRPAAVRVRGGVADDLARPRPRGPVRGDSRAPRAPDSEDESEESEAEATEVFRSEEKTPSALLCREKRASEHASAARADAFRLRVASRLVDFFITAHPAMPLYVGVEAMRRDRAYLLSLGTDDFAELHVALSKLRVAPDWRPSAG